MKHGRLAALAGALALLTVTAPMGATATTSSRGITPPPRAVAPLSQVRIPFGKRRVRAATLPTPPGCTSDGINSFVGETGNGTNFAGSNGGYAGVMAGYENESCDLESGIAWGFYNWIGGDGSGNNSFVGAGSTNFVERSPSSFIGAGYFNLLSAAAPYNDSQDSGVASGENNTIGSPLSFIGAGASNTIIGSTAASDGNGQSAFIGAGEHNSVSGNFSSVVGGSGNAVGGSYAAIGGGAKNSAKGEWGTVAGGNLNAASGSYAMVPGGNSNYALGNGSFAAGRSAQALGSGSFVWSDESTAPVVKSSANDQFVVRASGGVWFYTSLNQKSGVKLAAGSGSWSSLSDRAVKTAVVPVDDGTILAKVASLPVSEWSYTAQGAGIRHIGPMAQDFYAAFGVGEDDKHIATVDEDGVALAAIKALGVRTEQQSDTIRSLRLKVASDDAEIAALRREVMRLDSDMKRLTVVR